MNDVIIEITEPEVTTIESKSGLYKQDIYNYENSHVIYKGHDLGSFNELLKQKKENEVFKSIIDEIDTYLEYYLIANMKFKDSQKEFEKLHKMIVKTKENLLKI